MPICAVLTWRNKLFRASNKRHFGRSDVNVKTNKRNERNSTWASARKLSYLFWFLVAWTLTQFAMCVVEFFKIDQFTVPKNMPFAYFMLILIYVMRKEVSRWLKENMKKRRGEIFLIGWWLSLLVMFVIEFNTHGKYCVPKRMMETCIWILLPYIGTLISRIAYFYVEKRTAGKKKMIIK